MIRPRETLSLIGMAGVGKSTVGAALARRLGRTFLDTDDLLETAAGRPLQALLEAEGLAAFCAREAATILDVKPSAAVLATGGSVVYSEAAMQHLHSLGRLVHLRLPLAELEKRPLRLAERGFVRRPGQSFAEVYRERLPLYDEWADLTLDVSGLDGAEAAQAVLNAL
jgi:shikimate kinase